MDGLYDWFLLVTGFNGANIFRQDQENPDLGTEVNWLTYKEVSGLVRDYPLYKTTASEDNPGTQVDSARIIPGESIVSVNVYAANGADILRKLWLSKYERDPRVILKSAGVTLFQMSGPRDLSMLSDTKWKHRFQADFTFRVFTQIVETDYTVDTTELTGTIEDDTITI